MGKRIEAPITGGVLTWAIRESGYARAEVAAKAKVTEGDLEAWEFRTRTPTWSQVRALASALKRPVAIFFLPEAPAVSSPALEFRAPAGSQRTAPNPIERKAFRDVSRLQGVLSWIADELGISTETPIASLDERPETVGQRIRNWVGIDVITQESWKSGSKAFRAWRAALEDRRLYVLALPLGEGAVRGFSLWSETAPVVSVNTKWNHQARIFTLFHELAHLCTRHSSACLGYVNQRSDSAHERVERWCEQVAASALLPQVQFSSAAREAINARSTQDEQLKAVRVLADRFSVSLRATCLRLIELDLATWRLYDALPANSDSKEGGFGGKGRQREQMKEDQLGKYTKDTLQRGVQAELITKADALTYFDVEAERFSDEPAIL